MSFFYSHGKLLLTAEYLVLDGANALALPTKKGQSLEVVKTDTNTLQWQSILHDGSLWFETEISLPIKDQNIEDPILKRLYEILHAAQSLNPSFLSETQGYKATSILEFPRNWGLGSSSTLIANIAQWASVNPYQLLEKTFGGSGYDIACAVSETSITYTRSGISPEIHSVIFNPTFKEQLFFIHLNRKQNSRESITHYRNLPSSETKEQTAVFSSLTASLITAQGNLSEFEALLSTHEATLSKIIQTKTIKEQLFSDYKRPIKSLGGWGGDFILVVGNENEMSYFKEKGYSTIVSFSDMIL